MPLRIVITRFNCESMRTLGVALGRPDRLSFKDSTAEIGRNCTGQSARIMRVHAIEIISSYKEAFTMGAGWQCNPRIGTFASIALILALEKKP